MNLNVLRYVEAIAEEQSFSKAAARMYVAQPSLSQAIQQLERELGVTLFNRGARVVTLTPSGERYLRWAKIVLHSEKKMRSDITAQGGLRKLTVGSSPYRCRTLFPPAVQEFSHMAPGCQVVIKEAPHEKLSAMLDEGALDLLVEMPPPGRNDSVLLAQERILIAAHKSLLDKSGYTVTLRELLNLPVIFIDDAKYTGPMNLGPIIRRLYEDSDAVPNVVMECDSAEMAHIMAFWGLGYTLSGELYIEADSHPNMRYYEIEEYPLTRSVYAVWNASRPISPDTELFISLLQKHIDMNRLSGGL